MAQDSRSADEEGGGVAEEERVREITTEEGHRLMRLVRRSVRMAVPWRRARMVLLSAQGMDLNRIAALCAASPAHVRAVLHNFDDHGFNSFVPSYAGPLFTPRPAAGAPARSAAAFWADAGLARRTPKGNVPDFVGIGGQRCGTTWLYAHLSRHPQVRFPAGKELQYWNSSPEGPEEWFELFPAAPPGVKQGEITPAYAILPEPVVAEIVAAAPDLRLILNIRNPMQRAWSAAMLFSARCQMDPKEPSDAWFADVVRSRQCVAKSTFSSTIGLWRRMFSAEQLLLVLYDDLVGDPSGVLRRVAVHLDIDPTLYKRGQSELAQRQGIVTSELRQPSPEVVAVLRQVYAEEIDRLEPLLQRDLQHWRDWSGDQ
jgi:hypothetical protein